ncbi:helix-turn-helix domain-containing protein [Nocardioides sp. NPDC004968]|uniref:helix-turn-helix transcriptional regulator n=1 Tax=Nocardioides sp. NPDC004968 TaxID=3155894 RepID=UPI0033B82C6F
MRGSLGPSGPRSVALVHLECMDTSSTHLSLIHNDDEQAVLSAVLSLSELAAHLHVPVQTMYDLRSQGRGPRGFRVGRELRFRLTEVDAWLARLEAADAKRHPAPEHGGREPA